MKKLFKNKRGNAWINVLVILVLVTCLSAGFIFLTSSNKAEAVVSGVNVLNEVHSEESEFNFNVNQAGEKAVEETYKQLQEDEFPTLDGFFVNFQRQFEVYGLDRGYLKKENFVIEGNTLKIKIDNWQTQKNFKDKSNDLEVLYGRELNFEFDLK